MDFRKALEYIAVSRKRTIWFSIGLGVLYWITDSVIDAFIYREETLISQIVTPTSHEIFMRMVTIALLVLLIYINSISTKRRQAEEKLRESEKLYRMLAETAHDMIFIVNRDDYIQYVNNFAAEQFGTTPEQIIGKKRDELFPPEISNQQRQSLKKIFETGESLYVEERIVFPNRELWISAWLSPVRSKSGEIAAVMGVSRDITERKQAEERIKEAVLQWQSTFDAISDSIFIADAEGKILHCNKAFANFLNKQESEIIGRTCHEVVHDAKDFIKACPFIAAKKTRDSESIELKTGDKWFLVTVDPILNNSGDVISFVHAISDITEHKQAENEIKKINELLGAINRTQSQFIVDTAPSVIFDSILDSLLSLTQSQYGFIGEILIAADGKPYLKTHAITNIAWNEETRSFYEKYAPNMEFHNLKTLFGEVMITGNPVISNNPSTDPRRGGLPQGHPSLNCFLGIPFFYGNNMVGMVGIANRPDGYNEEIIEFLQPFLITCGNIIEAYRNNQQRRQAEDEINKIIRQQEAILDNIPDIAWLKDKESRFIAVNEPFGKACGFKPEELVGKTDLDIWPKELAERYRADDREVMASGKRKSVEEPLADKEGKIAWIETIKTPIHNEKGEVIGTTGIARDITERKKMEEQIFQITHDWADTFNIITDMITVHDKDFNIIRYNTAAEKILGLSFLNITKDKCYRFYHGTECPPVGCPSCQTFKTGVPSTVEIFEPHLNMFIEIRAIPRFDSEHQLIGLIHVVRDITERKKLEDQLRHAQKMEAIGTLTGGIAHDFSNILTAIIGYASLIRMEMDKDNPSRVNLDQILASSERAANLIQSLLAFSRKQISYPEPINICESIKNIEKLLLRVIGENITLKTILAGDLTVMADRVQMDQVLINLCTNARDAMPDGGTLIIKTEPVELDSEFIASHGYGEQGKYALISVTDSGAGMDEKTIKRIFEPFFTTKEVGKGTGLGLAIIYGIIKQHKGFINCYSEPGKGTTFKIYLPMIKSEVKVMKEIEISEQIAVTETVLLAEDEIDVRNLTRQMLEGAGYRVIEAVDGEDAVNKFIKNKDKIALLLFDVIMPKMNGKEAYDRIKKIKPDIKILLTSGYPADFINKEEIYEERLNFVSKPISPSELLKKLREALNK